MGTDQGIYPWVVTLVMGNLMVRPFWVGRGCLSTVISSFITSSPLAQGKFSSDNKTHKPGGEGGEEKSSGHGQQGRSLDDVFSNSPIL
jgi:hypothetical protein